MYILLFVQEVTGLLVFASKKVDDSGTSEIDTDSEKCTSLVYEDKRTPDR